MAKSKTSFCSTLVHPANRFEVIIQDPTLKQILQQNAALGALAPFKRLLPKSCQSRPLTACEWVDATDLGFLMDQFAKIHMNMAAAQRQVNKATAGFQLTASISTPTTLTLLELQTKAKATGLWEPSHGVMCGSPDEPCGCDPHDDGLRFSFCKCLRCVEAGPGHWCA